MIYNNNTSRDSCEQKNTNGKVHPSNGPKSSEMLSTYHFQNFSDDQVLPKTTVEYLLVLKKWLGTLLWSPLRGQKHILLLLVRQVTSLDINFLTCPMGY